MYWQCISTKLALQKAYFISPVPVAQYIKHQYNFENGSYDFKMDLTYHKKNINWLLKEILTF